MTVLGIDPGLSGGVAWIGPEGASALPLPILAKTPDLDRLREILREARPDWVAVERVQGGKSQAGQLLMGINYGMLLGALRTLGLPLLEVTPQRWKRDAGLSADKGESILRARDLFPAVDLVLPGCRKAHDGMAEALLIADWCRKERGGKRG